MEGYRGKIAEIEKRAICVYRGSPRSLVARFILPE